MCYTKLLMFHHKNLEAILSSPILNYSRPAFPFVAVYFVIWQHCVKSVRFRSFSGPYFPAFVLNSERYEVSLRIQSECWKIRTRKTPNTDTFHAVQPQQNTGKQRYEVELRPLISQVTTRHDWNFLTFTGIDRIKVLSDTE